MNIAESMPDLTDTAGCKFVEVLTAEDSGDIIGYRFGGNLPGPNALIAGDASLMQALFDRLKELPTLPWMWGRLYLITLDGVDCTDLEQVQRHLSDVELDELVMLPHAKGMQTHQHSVERAYWTTLRLCRKLGMIAGRGVQPD